MDRPAIVGYQDLQPVKTRGYIIRGQDELISIVEKAIAEGKK